MAKNGVEVIVFNGKKWLNETNIKSIKWLNGTNVKDQLKHSNLVAFTLQYSTDLIKQKQELQDFGNYQPCRRFSEEDFTMQIIMDCRKTPAVNFKTKLGFNQHDPVMTQEQISIVKNCDIICS